MIERDEAVWFWTEGQRVMGHVVDREVFRILNGERIEERQGTSLTVRTPDGREYVRSLWRVERYRRVA